MRLGLPQPQLILPCHPRIQFHPFFKAVSTFVKSNILKGKVTVMLLPLYQYLEVYVGIAESLLQNLTMEEKAYMPIHMLKCEEYVVNVFGDRTEYNFRFDLM